MVAHDFEKSDSGSATPTQKQNKSIGLFYVLVLLVIFLAPVVNCRSIPKHGAVVPRKSIVVYHNNVTDASLKTFKKFVLKKLSKHGDGYEDRINSFSMPGMRGLFLDCDDDDMLSSIEQSDEVKYIEPDHKVSANILLSQPNAPGGLARISHRLPNTKDYIFDSTAGQGIVVYVIDTGIMLNHTEFQGRATWGKNFINQVDMDEHGHGSHVAGTIGGITYGVAKAATMIAVKTLDADGQGETSGLIAALQWVSEEVTRRKLAGRAVINMSIGGPRSEAMNSAIDALTQLGVTVVVAAGNENSPAGLFSPASAPSAITVGAIYSNDTKAVFSNYGEEVDIFAPGVKIQSVGIKGINDTTAKSGTSMAAPHVAGMAAYLISLENITDPVQVAKRMQELANASTQEQVSSIAYNGNGY